MRTVAEVFLRVLRRNASERPASESGPPVSEKRRKLLKRLNTLDTGPHVRDEEEKRSRATSIEIEKERLKSRGAESG
ncbi:Hypothetical Protein RradSPS_1113 [Rubrobacter radiotolerans]|uniref:Uncharacterized protein n=1 Tax=Rubrobacter radiotolerans TaxID=42256 RepID=A0A023X2F0_RUBRA|nr:hypothetical protein [Rubrobacter radiotolerans]AHY46396.1 Hypothetical Protein RradSPS_1113 [Rubrobacter radiotolerans]SMC04532.1 conserved hypothetical protein [Rubrobacter radiotolerans DSM 5868]